MPRSNPHQPPPTKPPFWKRPIGCSGCLLFIVVGFVLLSALLSSGDRRRGGRPAAAPGGPRPSAAIEPDLLTSLSERFEGAPSPDRIRRAMESVIAQYDLPATDDSRKGIASVAMRFRAEEGVPEILLLEYMARHPFEGLTFPQAAAVALTAYLVDYPNGQ